MPPLRRATVLLPLLGVLAVARPAAAQTEDSTARPADTTTRASDTTATVADTVAKSAAGSASTMRIARAARLQGSIVLDGRLDEPAWGQAPVITGFTESYPNPGAAPRMRTEVRVLYDDQALYVGARMFDPRPDSIAAQLARRDATGIYSDWLHVMIGSYGDRRTAFRFSVNPRGVQKDVLTYDDGNEDLNWDAVWQVATLVDSLGWTAEYRIPFSQLRFRPFRAGETRVWDFQVMRDIARYEARYSWSPWTTQSPGFVSSFGELAGLTAIPNPTRLELQPYVSGRLTRAPGAAGDPFYSSSEVGARAGADVKYGLPAGLTLTGTINPDFGQVEVDPAVVNLSAFETFFPEKRPFFLEGANIFQFGQVQSFNNYNSEYYFYSRRVGRAPQLAPAGGDVQYADAPNETTILGAAKVSGKIGPWSVGVLDALTAEERARYQMPGGVRGSAPVEPATNYAVARVQRDFRRGATVLGAMGTATNRRMNAAAFSPLLRSGAYFGGVDFQHSWADRNWTLSGYLGGSRVVGSQSAIARTQRSSARYFQRPDAGYVTLDTTRTALDGRMGELALAGRLPGKDSYWEGSLDYKETSPGFEINDIGFQNRTDYRSFSSLIAHWVNRPGRLFRNYGYFAYANQAWNFGGANTLNSYSVSAQGTFNSLWGVGGTLTRSEASFADGLTRGGPLARRPAGWAISMFGNSDSRKVISGDAGGSYSWDASGARTTQVQVGATVRPSASVSVSVGPSLQVGRSTRQYVLAAPDERATATFGRRYVFADLRQTTLSMDTRVSWTFSPTLSLQLYAQPFVASGAYSRFKEFLQPRTDRFGIYGADQGTICAFEGSYAVDPVAARSCPTSAPAGDDPNFTIRFGNPDFTVRSLRGNAVVRWEYRPGSALYFVWQQERSGFLPAGDFDFGRDAGALFREPATNVFLVKAVYWIGR